MQAKLLILILFMSQVVFSQNISDYVFIEGGIFKMGSKNGSEDEKDVHKVKISNFYVLNHEVTNAEFVTFLNEMGNQFENHVLWINLDGFWRDIKCRIYQKEETFYVEEGYENYPVIFVNWYGANAYAKWAGGRLPTEAEWEYIADLSVKSLNYPNNLNDYAFYKENSDYKLHPVKQKLPIIGIYDLFGNLSEWCYDWYSVDYYKNSKYKNPQGAFMGDQKIKRGGSFATLSSSVKKYNRKASSPTNNNLTIGFRIVIDTK